MNLNMPAGTCSLKAVAALTWNLMDLLKKVFRRKNWMANPNNAYFEGNY